MIDEVLRGIYKIQVPLPIPVVGSMNCYVLKDRKRSLVVDPGMAHEMCYRAVTTGLGEIGIDLEETDFLITHHHVDHFPLVARIMKKGSKIYGNSIEAQIIEKIASGAILPILSRFLHSMGFPEENPERVLSELLGEEYRALNPWPFHFIENGSHIIKGSRSFRCILTPGHSPGHTCLYQSDSKLLIAGDVFSPVLFFFTDTDNPLRSHFASFTNLNLIGASTILPGHGDILTDIKQTTERLVTHHKERNSEIVRALSDRSMDAYEVANRLAVGTQGSGNWNNLPAILKFIATRDCFAHLVHLEADDWVRKNSHAGRMVYSLTESTKRLM